MLSEIELLECERMIQTALGRASSHTREPVEVRTPLTDAMLREEMRDLAAAVQKTEDEFREEPMAMFQELLRRIFDFLYEDGPHPGCVMRRLYLLAYRYFPHLVLEMNGTHIGELFGETKASESLRLNLIYDRLKASGVRGSRGATSKGEETRDTYAKASKGNHNRNQRSLKKKP